MKDEFSESYELQIDYFFVMCILNFIVVKLETNKGTFYVGSCYDDSDH